MNEIPIVWVHTEKELESWNAFVEKHKACAPDISATHGKFPYVAQFGAGVGVITKAHCQYCGEIEDITDRTGW